MRDIDFEPLIAMLDDPQASGQEIVSCLRDLLKVGHVAFMILRCPGVVIYGNNYGYSTYPQAWIETYISKGYWRVDPAIDLALKRASPFDWDEALSTKAILQMWDEAAKHGICSQGFTIPVHGPSQETSILSISARWRTHSTSWWASYRRTMVRDLLPIAMAFQDRCFQELGVGRYSEPMPLLSHAEREILYWAAEGKTAWETAKILNKSKKTIEFHLKSCQDKLGAVNKGHMLSRAISTGLITYQHMSS